MKLRFLVKGLLVIFSLVIVGFLLHFGQGVDTNWIDHQVAHRGGYGVAIFIIAGGLFITVGLPRQVIAFLGGYGFDVWFGTLYGVCAATIGCILSFYYSRFIGRSLFAVKLGKRVEKWNAFISDNPFKVTFIIRLLPLGSNLLTNLVAGLSNISAVFFISASSLGYIPQTLIFALIGSGIKVNPAYRISIGVVLFILSAYFALNLYRKYRSKEHNLAEIDEALEETV